MSNCPQRNCVFTLFICPFCAKPTVYLHKVLKYQLCKVVLHGMNKNAFLAVKYTLIRNE